ncbi:MAG: hypothetical protein AB7I50_25920 [Vicinamibacterales bacterium]
MRVIAALSSSIRRHRTAFASGILCLALGWPALTGGSEAVAQSAGETDGHAKTLIARVRANLEKERRLLLEYAYRERRRPIKVSPLGRVSIDADQTFDVFPSSDPDRPRRVLVAVDGRPPTADERQSVARRQDRDAESRTSAAERERRNAQRRRRAQERLEDAFRVFRFEAAGEAVLNGVRTNMVRVLPRPEAPTRSDVGRWLKKFTGTAWVSVADDELVQLDLTATDTISLGWGVIGRIGAGTKIHYERRRTPDGVWLPASARFDARGRTLLFRAFAVESVTEWFDYRPYTSASENTTSDRPVSSQP